MANRTELIFGARFKKDTPTEIIEALKYMLGEVDRPDNFPFPNGKFEYLFTNSSYSFAVSNPVGKLWLDDNDNQWRISTRSNISNYDNEIETFLRWIKPYIHSGSGIRELYAIVISENSINLTAYYLEQ